MYILFLKLLIASNNSLSFQFGIYLSIKYMLIKLTLLFNSIVFFYEKHIQIVLFKFKDAYIITQS